MRIADDFITDSFSLYVDLVPGKFADIEVVGRAAIALSQAVKELAYIVAPESAVKIELISGTEGSLSLNSIIKVLRTKPSAKLIGGLVVSVITPIFWFGLEHSRDWVFEKTLERLFIAEPAHHLSDEEKREIAESVTKALTQQLAKQQVQQVYRELDTDPAVSGVGATHHIGRKPTVIIPRSEFRVRSGHGVEQHEKVQQRKVIVRRLLSLVSPVLLQGDRKWEFSDKISAKIKDQSFLKSVLSGQLSIRMVAGIELDVDLETTEILSDGVWQIQDRSITKVHRVLLPPQTGFGLSGDNDPDQ